MQQIVICICSFVFVFANVTTAHGQSLHRSFDGICRIETDTGRGTGFVVAASDGRIEVWTNAHVAGEEGKRVRVRFGTGSSREISMDGVVAWSRYENAYDAAKIICHGRYDGDVFNVCTGGCGGRLSITGGHPYGGRAYAVRLEQYDEKNFGIVRAYKPASIEGQSGSPIVNDDGTVIGVVTLRFGNGPGAVGGALPITQWTKSETVSFRQLSFGPFEVLGNAKF